MKFKRASGSLSLFLPSVNYVWNLRGLPSVDYVGYYEGTFTKTAVLQEDIFFPQLSKTWSSLICFWGLGLFARMFHLCSLKKERLFPRKTVWLALCILGIKKEMGNSQSFSLNCNCWHIIAPNIAWSSFTKKTNHECMRISHSKIFVKVLFFKKNLNMGSDRDVMG